MSDHLFANGRSCPQFVKTQRHVKYNTMRYAYIDQDKTKIQE